MNISLEKKGNVTALITIKMEKADYEDKVKSTLKDYGKKVQMPGFRPGHVPAGLVKKMYGTQVKADTVNNLLGESLYKYINDNKVKMLGEPLASEEQKPQDIETQDDFEFAFDIALAPEFKFEATAADNVDYYDITIDDAQVDAQVKQIAQQGGHPEEAEEYADRDILRGTLAELDENGQPKEGGVVAEKVSLMPAYFKNDDQKKIFEGAKKNDVITFNPATAYDNSASELAALLKIEKEDAESHKGNFSFQVDSISRFVPAEINQELFDQVFGEGNVKSEEEFRGKIKEGIANQHTADSDYKFLVDFRAYAENKVGTLEFPEELLKRFLKSKNAEKGEEYVEENFQKSLAELKWHLIKEQLVEATGIKVDDKDLKATAIQTARFQFAQYGMNNVPDEYLEQYATEMLKNKEQVDMFVERTIDSKLIEALKGIVTLNHKEIALDDFIKLVNGNNE